MLIVGDSEHGCGDVVGGKRHSGEACLMEFDVGRASGNTAAAGIDGTTLSIDGRK